MKTNADAVRKVVTEAAKGFRDGIKISLQASYLRILNNYVALAAEKNETDPHRLYPCTGTMRRDDYHRNRHLRGIICTVTDSAYTGPHTNTYTVKLDAKAIFEKRAEKEADATVASYIEKMTKKLTGIVDAKGDLRNIQVVGESLLWHTLDFAFDDGSKFSVTNSMIINHSVHGLPFNQFPTRFHDVVLRGEATIKMSEAQMKKTFK
jgi:hypothetical protein